MHDYENCVTVFSFASEPTLHSTSVVSLPHNEHEPVSRAGYLHAYSPYRKQVQISSVCFKTKLSCLKNEKTYISRLALFNRPYTKYLSFCAT
jgi:hypothetical protein